MERTTVGYALLRKRQSFRLSSRIQLLIGSFLITLHSSLHIRFRRLRLVCSSRRHLTFPMHTRLSIASNALVRIAAYTTQ